VYFVIHCREHSGPSFPVNAAAVRSEDWTLEIISAAASPLPEASPTASAKRLCGRGTKSKASPPSSCACQRCAL
jgi:hypothetical protein